VSTYSEPEYIFPTSLLDRVLSKDKGSSLGRRIASTRPCLMEHSQDAVSRDSSICVHTFFPSCGAFSVILPVHDSC
jgi:hypothetical protein